jgi:hypothetical protein
MKKLKKVTAAKKNKAVDVRDKNGRWKELAQFRLAKIDADCRSLEKLANTKHYEYSEVEVNNLIAILETVINRVTQTYRNCGKNYENYTL